MRRARPAGFLTVARMQSVCVFYILLWCLVPQLAIDAPWRIALAGAFAGWFALEGLRNGLAHLANGPAALTLTFLGYTLAVQLLTGGPADVVRGVQLDICLVVALIGIAYRGARLRELEWLVVPVLAVLCVSLALTYKALANDPHAARLVVRSSAAALELLRAGVGGYQLVYAAALLAPLLFLLTLASDWPRSLLAWAMAGALAAAAAVVLAAGYGIAVVIVLTGMLAALGGGGDGRGRLLRALVVLAAAAVLLVALDPLLAFTEAMAEGTKYAKKLADLRESISLGESVGTTSERLSRYLRSLSLFAGSPLWGVLYYDSLGKHSQILDTFARYGAPIGLIGLYVLVRLPALLLAPLPRGSAHAPLVLMLALSLFLGLNTGTAAPGAVAYLLAPMLTFACGRRAFAGRAARPARSGMRHPAGRFAHSARLSRR